MNIKEVFMQEEELFVDRLSKSTALVSAMISCLVLLKMIALF